MNVVKGEKGSLATSTISKYKTEFGFGLLKSKEEEI